MTLAKRTVVDQIEITGDGTLNVRFALQIHDAGEVIQSAWHRTCFPPGHDIQAQINAVNDHMAEMGKAPVPVSDVARIQKAADAFWDQATIDAYRAKQQAALDALQASLQSEEVK